MGAAHAVSKPDPLICHNGGPGRDSVPDQVAVDIGAGHWLPREFKTRSMLACPTKSTLSAGVTYSWR